MDICKNNKGITLIELIIAMAISSIVLAAVAMFLSVSTNSYRRETIRVSLQSEAMNAVNQMEDLIMQSYNVKFDTTKKELKVYQEDAEYTITLKEDAKLYYKKSPKSGTPTSDQIFANYVEDFYVEDTGTSNANKNIKITLVFKNGKETFAVDKSSVSIRNRIKPVGGGGA